MRHCRIRVCAHLVSIFLATCSRARFGRSTRVASTRHLLPCRQCCRQSRRSTENTVLMSLDVKVCAWCATLDRTPAPLWEHCYIWTPRVLSSLSAASSMSGCFSVSLQPRAPGKWHVPAVPPGSGSSGPQHPLRTPFVAPPHRLPCPLTVPPVTCGHPSIPTHMRQAQADTRPTTNAMARGTCAASTTGFDLVDARWGASSS